MTLTEILLAIVTGAIGSFIVWWIFDGRKRRKKPKPVAYTKEGIYDLTDPAYLLGIRADRRFGFDPYYYRRDYLDKAIHSKLVNFESFIVIGAPLSGKRGRYMRH